jgi:hypothetical protein
MSEAPVFAGVDVSNAHLDVALTSAGQVTSVPNSERGIERRFWARHNQSLISLEKRA